MLFLDILCIFVPTLVTKIKEGRQLNEKEIYRNSHPYVLQTPEDMKKFAKRMNGDLFRKKINDNIGAIANGTQYEYIIPWDYNDPWFIIDKKTNEVTLVEFLKFEDNFLEIKTPSGVKYGTKYDLEKLKKIVDFELVNDWSDFRKINFRIVLKDKYKNLIKYPIL